MKLKREQLPANLMLAAEIELVFDVDDDHEIWAPEDHANALEPALRSHDIIGFHREPLVTQGSDAVRSIHRILVSGEVDKFDLIRAVRDFLEKRGLHWFEPYGEGPNIQYFSFILPYETLFKQ